MSDEKGSGRRRSSSYYTKAEGKGRSTKDQRSSASYKSDLEKLFQSGGKVPERFQGIMDELKPEEGSPEAARAEAIERLEQAEDFRAFVKEINAYRKEGHRLPDDEDLLGRMLDHPSEAVLGAVLSHLLDLHRRQTLEGSAALKARLKTIKQISDDPSLHERADKLLKVL